MQTITSPQARSAHSGCVDLHLFSPVILKFISFLQVRISEVIVRISIVSIRHPSIFASKISNTPIRDPVLPDQSQCLTAAMQLTKRHKMNLPGAFSVQPSGQLLGNDGNWSTFALQAGNNSQNFQVVVSTSSQEIWLPIPQGCEATNSTGPVPSNCSELRGVGLTAGAPSQGFIDNSTTSNDIGIYGVTLGPSLDINALGSMYSVIGNWDLDTASLSSINQVSSVTGDQIPIVGLTSWSFFMASLGLGYGTITNGYGSFPSFSESLVKASEIPGRSWAYTAGAYYRERFCLLTTASKN